jgi:HSP20 family protein
MAITRYRDGSLLSPWRELDQMSSRLNRLFGDAEAVGWVPPVNVEETGDELVLTAELPGLRQGDVEIELENGVLTIRGQKEEFRTEGDERRYHVWERRYGTFQRSFTLPRSVSADSISATFEDGVLHVRMPKAAEAKGRKIEIRSST